MHFVFVERGFPRNNGEVGGAGTYVKIYGLELIKRGHVVSVICGKNQGDRNMYVDDGIDVYPDSQNHPIAFFLQKFYIFNFLLDSIKYLENGISIRRIIKKINRKKKIDIIEFSEGGDFWTSIFKDFYFISHLHGSAFTFRKNSYKKIGLKDWLKRKAELFFIKRADKVVSPSNALANLVEKELKEELNIDIIPYPINSSLEQPIAIKEKSDKSLISIIFASRNDPVKGGELLIESLHNLNDQLKKIIKVYIYGYLPKRDIKGLSFLEVHDFISAKELKERYLKSDICIVPSIFDNSPNTVYEAMSYGKVIVASNAGVIPEIIGSSKNGFIFKKNNATDLTEKISSAIKLITSGDSIKMRKNARNRILEMCSVQKNVDDRLRLIQKPE